MSDINAPNPRSAGESPASLEGNGVAADSGQGPSPVSPRRPGPTRERPSRGRWTAAIILLVVGCLLAPLALVATWARNEVLDTNRYVATVSPLAADPAIQNAVATIITTKIFTGTNVQSTIQDVLPAKAAFLAAPLTRQLQTYTRNAVQAVVASPRFQTLWERANRAAHTLVVRVLTGSKENRALTVTGGTVTLNLAPVAARVKARLDQAGMTNLDQALTRVNGQIEIFHSDRLAKAGNVVTRARNAVNLLQQLAIVLPLLALAALAAAIVVAPVHRPAVLWAGLGVALAMLALAIGLAVLRSFYLDAINPNVLPQDAAAAFFDTVVRFLRDGLRALLVLGLVVAAGAALAGPSRTATRLRERVRHIGDESATTGWASGAVTQWVAHHRPALDAGLVAVGALVLVWWNQPTVGVIIFLSAVVLIGVACIEVLSRAGQVAAAH
jgi:hypothetical protein